MGFVIFLTLLLVFSVYDGKEHDSLGTGAKAPEDFPDSVAANTSDYGAGE